jgi:hypothetical protein
MEMSGQRHAPEEVFYFRYIHAHCPGPVCDSPSDCQTVTSPFLEKKRAVAPSHCERFLLFYRTCAVCVISPRTGRRAFLSLFL